MCICCVRNDGNISDEIWNDYNNLYICCSILTKIPTLPIGLTKFYVECPNLTEPPQFLDGLIKLSLVHYYLSEMPILPNSLTNLMIMSARNLQTLPTMPNNLRKLSCINCLKLSRVNFSPQLVTIELENCGIESLPDFPASVSFLEICNNPVRKIPELPANLISLVCSDCYRLEKLPDIILPGIDLDIDNCPWLNHEKNPYFSSNISVLKKAQRKLKAKHNQKYLINRYVLKKFLPPCLVEKILAF